MRRDSIIELPSGEALAEFDGFCLELVDKLLHEHGGQILYIEPPKGRALRSLMCGPWSYHAALLLDGVVYDAWHPNVRLPPAEYTRTVFGGGATFEINPGGSS